MIGFSDLFFINDPGSGDLLGILSTVETDENFGNLAEEAFSRNHFTIFSMLNSTKVILFLNFRQTVEHLDDRVQVA